MAEVEPMLTAVMGRPPSPAVLAAAKRKYAAIGGKSPLVAVARDVAARLEAAWNTADVSPAEVPVGVGMCFTPPFIRDVVADLARAGRQRLLYLSMTPFVSYAAWGLPLELLLEAAEPLGIEVLPVPAIGTFEPYIRGQIEQLGATVHADDAVLFVAHSLPIDDGREDSQLYSEQIAAAARVIAHELGLSDWRLAYVSKAARGGRWLEPDADAALAAIAEQGRARAVTVCPLGFATDHMEVLYDLDVAARAAATRLNLKYRRAQTLGQSRALIDAYLAATRSVADTEPEPAGR
jgi:ferrochelatase